MTASLELRGITKRFPGVVANDRIDLDVSGGEIRAILGENGAGKTTLMRILYGLEQPDEGTIRLHGRACRLRSPQDAIGAGLGMVHQHFLLFPSLTVGENVVFGREPRRRGLIDRRATRSKVAELAEAYGLDVDPRARVAALPVGVRQRVEILKMLYRRAEILILDEPTTVLTPGERDRLFGVLRRLAGQGKTVLFITHKLQEVMDLADRATVLRRGKVRATVEVASSSPEELSRLMVGREVAPAYDVGGRPESDVLTVEGLCVDGEGGRSVVDGVSFRVRAGEIVAVVGVAGNGQTELVEALAGLRPIRRGNVVLGDREITRATIAARRRAGLAYIPEDRNRVGLALEATLAENLLAGSLHRADLCRYGVVSKAGVAAWANRLIARFDIRGRAATRAGALSGGHRQRVVAARELAFESLLVIAEHPTQGIDVGAAEELLSRLAAVRDDGRAVLWISTELSEVLRLADRILVIFEGRVVADVPARRATEQGLGLLMAGAGTKAA